MYMLYINYYEYINLDGETFYQHLYIACCCLCIHCVWVLFSVTHTLVILACYLYKHNNNYYYHFQTHNIKWNIQILITEHICIRTKTIQVSIQVMLRGVDIVLSLSTCRACDFRRNLSISWESRSIMKLLYYNYCYATYDNKWHSYISYY